MNVSTQLLLVIGICFLLQMFVPQFTETFIFNPYLALSEPWRFVTSMFLHDPRNLMHIFFNAYALFMFGSILETQITKRDYLTIFFGAGLLGGLLYYLTTFSPWPPLCETISGDFVLCSALGASGAIFGILGATAVMLPNLRIFFFFFPMKIRYAAILWVVLELVGTFNMVGGGVASAAHLGGLVFGLVFAWMIKRRVKEVQSWEWDTEFR